MIVDSAHEVNFRILVMIDDDILVRELEVQLSNHSLGKLVLNSVLIVAKVGNDLGQATDETETGFRDRYEISAISRHIMASQGTDPRP